MSPRGGRSRRWLKRMGFYADQRKERRFEVSVREMTTWQSRVWELHLKRPGCNMMVDFG